MEEKLKLFKKDIEYLYKYVNELNEKLYNNLESILLSIDFYDIASAKLNTMYLNDVIVELEEVYKKLVRKCIDKFYNND